MKIITKCSLSVIALAVLSACNGGGGDSSPGTNSTAQNAQPIAPVVINEVATDFKSDCDMATSADCGSKTSSIYAGNGIGIYKYTNNTNSSVTVNLGINGINAKGVYLVYSNPTNSDVTLADGSGVGIKDADNIKTASVYDAHNHSDVIPVPDISKMLATQNKKILSVSTPVPTPVYDVGTVRQQYNSVVKDSPLINTVLVAKKQFTNGSWLYMWADSSVQYDSQKLNDIADTYTKKDGIFDTLTAISGELVVSPKDQQILSLMISPANKDQHVIFTKLNDNVTGLGSVTGIANPGSVYKSDVMPKSNMQHEIYISIEIFDVYKDSKSAKEIALNTMAHETQHELTFLNKDLKQGIRTDVGFNEFYSVMAESVNSSIQKDSMANNRMSGYLKTNNCSYFHSYVPDANNPECDSISAYSSSYAVGAYLLRKYGAEFLGDIEKSSVNSFDELDSFIKTYNAKDSLADVIQKVSAIPLMKNKPVKGYEYPQKQTKYSLDAISSPCYTFNSNVTFECVKRFKTVPATLKSMSSVIQDLGVVNSALILQDNAPLQKYITVPAGVTVTAVVN